MKLDESSASPPPIHNVFDNSKDTYDATVCKCLKTRLKNEILNVPIRFRQQMISKRKVIAKSN